MEHVRRHFLASTTLVASGATASFSHANTAREIIDCQSHLFCPALVKRMEESTSEPNVFRRDGVRTIKMGDWYRKIPDHYMSVEDKLASMDRAGISRTALSINDPGPEWFGKDGVEVAQIANDYIAEIVSKHPRRFFGLCVLPFQDIPATLHEMKRCSEQLGMKGILLYTNLAGEFSDSPRFAPFWELAEQLNFPVLLHPAKPTTIELVKAYEMTSTLGNMFENTIALTRLVMSGLLDRHPRLQLVCPHLGGTLPYILGRLDHQLSVLKRGPRLPRTPLDYLKQIWLDIVSPLPEAIRFCHTLFGPERLIYASDHPWVEPEVILNALEKAALPPDDVPKILSTNAQRLFRL